MAQHTKTVKLLLEEASQGSATTSQGSAHVQSIRTLQEHPMPSGSSKQESMECVRSVLQKLMASPSPPIQESMLTRPPPIARKRKEMAQKEELWPNTAIDALLTEFEDVCFNAKRGHLGKTHWGRIAAAINGLCGANYSGIQCKYKWNRLKKSYNKAKGHGDPSRFRFYQHVERIVQKQSEGDVDSTCEAPSDESIHSDQDSPPRRFKSFGRKTPNLAQTMESIEKTRTDEIKKLLDAQLQITTVLVQSKKALKQSDGVTGSSTQEIKETGLVHQQKGLNAAFVPPVNFAMVEKGVYRSGFPNNTNFPFLKTLQLRSIIYLCPEPYSEDNMEFLRAQEIQLFHFGIDSYKDPIAAVPEGVIREALKVLLDIRNHPVLIHCKRGKRHTSCLVGCFRKVHNWCLASVFEEYQRFAGIKNQALDLQFIEQFDAPST